MRAEETMERLHEIEMAKLAGLDQAIKAVQAAVNAAVGPTESEMEQMAQVDEIERLRQSLAYALKILRELGKKGFLSADQAAVDIEQRHPLVAELAK